MARTIEQIELDIASVRIALVSPNKSVKIDDMTQVFKNNTELLDALALLNNEKAELETGSTTPITFAAKRRGFR